MKNVSEWIYLLVEKTADDEYKSGEYEIGHIETSNPLTDIEAIVPNGWRIKGVVKGGADIIDFIDEYHKGYHKFPCHYEVARFIFSRLGYVKGGGSDHNSWQEYVQYILGVAANAKNEVRYSPADGKYVCWSDRTGGYDFTLLRIQE